jgi:hypothetical protein
MRLAALPVEGLTLDRGTVAPLFVLDEAGLRPRPPGLALADGLADADVAALPGLWSAYGGEACRHQVVRWLDEADGVGVPVIVWVDGDREVDLDHRAAILFEHGPSRSRAGRVHAWPVLIHDHLQVLYGGDLAPRVFGPSPVVGFCGQADATLAGRARLVAGKLWGHVAHRTGRTDRLPPPLRSHLALRRKALAVLAAAPGVETDFVVRDRYRAGLRDRADRADRTHLTAREFFTNVRETEYTVCVRGGGNFSTRLYETLCLGRIPIIVDTDLVLPWTARVAWDDIAVMVPASELEHLPDRLRAFHERFDADSFAAHQLRCRALWAERLSVPGFFAHFEEHFK